MQTQKIRCDVGKTCVRKLVVFLSSIKYNKQVLDSRRVNFFKINE